jgi:hypothetical protein
VLVLSVSRASVRYITKATTPFDKRVVVLGVP